MGGAGDIMNGNGPSVGDWVIQVPLWPSDLGIGLWNW